jgi:hypothetical protein
MLVEILRYIDNIGVFDRTNNDHPFLLHDGHGSRFELPFLRRFINDKEGNGTKWTACLGVPYGTGTGKLVTQVNRMAVLKWRSQVQMQTSSMQRVA